MSARQIHRVALLGAGTMGPGMAAVLAAHGLEVRLQDINPEMLDRAQQGIPTIFGGLVRGGFLTEDAAASGMQRIAYTADLEEALRGVEFVLEAIPEKLSLKQQVFEHVETLVSAETVLASNTSGIPITEIGRSCRQPARVVGMHWSNPPHLIPVIEIIRGERTSDETVETTCDLARRAGMIPVLVRRDVPGFVENRILYAIMREALALLDQGVASAEDIDTIVRWGIGYKLAVIGPLALLDVAGLDIYHSVASYLNRDLNSSPDVSLLVRQKVQRGELGIKTGRGLFTYTPEQIASLGAARARRLMAVKRALLDGQET